MDNTDYSGFIPGWAADPGAGYTNAPAVGLPTMAGPPLSATDAADAAQMQPYAPAGNAMPWTTQSMLFGFTKAVDNLSRVTVAGNTDPGSFAGYNGGTFSQIPQGQGGGVARTATATPGTSITAKLTGNPMLLLAVAIVAFVALKK